MNETNETQQLIDAIKARGWQGATRTVLDVVEPIAPLVSQALLVIQPMATVFGARTMIGELAEALDTRDGFDQLRKELDEK